MTKNKKIIFGAIIIICAIIGFVIGLHVQDITIGNSTIGTTGTIPMPIVITGTTLMGVALGIFLCNILDIYCDCEKTKWRPKR